MDSALWWLTTLCSSSLACACATLLLAALSRMRALKIPPRALRAAWIVVAVCLLVPLRWDWTGRPAIRLTLSQPAGAMLTGAPTQGVDEANEMATPSAAPRQRQESRPSWPQALLATWLLGAAFTYAALLLRHARAARLLLRWRSEASVEVRAIFQREARALGLGQRVRLACSEATQTPILTGLLRPTLYLPAGPALEALSGTRLTDILRHELIHAASHDLWLRALFLLGRAVHWFNPVLLLMDREFTLHSEMAADARLTARESGARRFQYAEAILDAARGPEVCAPMTMYFIGGKHTMKRRIDGIMNGHRERLGALALVLAILTLMLAPAVVAETADQVLVPPMASPAWSDEESEAALARLIELVLEDYGLTAETLPDSEEAAALMQALSEGAYFPDPLYGIEGDEGTRLLLRLASFELLPSISKKLSEGVHDLTSHVAAGLYRDYMTSLEQSIEDGGESEDDGSLAYMRAQLEAWEATAPAAAQAGE